jgi:ABC-type transporter lipoprotein component MlaA
VVVVGFLGLELEGLVGFVDVAEIAEGDVGDAAIGMALTTDFGWFGFRFLGLPFVGPVWKWLICV